MLLTYGQSAAINAEIRSGGFTMGRKKNVEEEACETCINSEGTEGQVTEEVAATTKEKKIRGPRISAAVVSFVRFPEEGEKKLPKQATQILEILAEEGASGITISSLLEKMEPVIVTRQGCASVYRFYQPILLKAGYITVG